VGFVAAAAVEAVVRYRSEPDALAVNLPGALVFACLALRRGRPLLTLTIFVAFSCVGSLVQARLAPQAPSDAAVPIFALLVATYSLGAHGSRRALLAGAPQPVLLVLVLDLVHPSRQPLVSSLLFFAVFVVAVPILAGRLVRGRTTLVAALREQAGELAALRTAQIRAALAAERLRLADELQSRLVTGMESLAAQVAAARSAAAEQGEAIAGVEQSARALLRQTRETVVALAVAPPVDEAHADPAERAPAQVEMAWRGAAQPWTVLAGGAFCLGLLLEVGGLPLRVPMLVAVPACVVVALPLALAWVRPLLMITALWAAAALFVAFVAPLGTTLSAVALSFAAPFIVAALEPRRWAATGLGVCCLGELACFGPGAAPGNIGIAGCCWLVGAIVHERQRLVDQLHRNNSELAEGRALAARQAVVEERGRVARELHDAVGHSLTVVALQAGAARRVWRTDPAAAESVLATIVEVTRAGLADLRTGFDEGGLDDPGPGRDLSLAELVDGARAAGLAVSASLDATTALSGGARLAAYRVVQESLTNVLKHASGAATEVVVRTSGAHVDVIVSNAPPSGPVHEGQGHGLSGMRRRVEACGGTIRWGTRTDGGFEVRAELPVALVTT
jgi:signal transduction histidine kinase